MVTQPEPVDPPLAAETLTRVAEHLWGLLGELDDAESELTVSAATRRRVEGAALALGALTGRPSGRTAVM